MIKAMYKKTAAVFFVLALSISLLHSQTSNMDILKSANILNKNISISADSLISFNSNANSNPISLSLIVVPAGSYTMGSSPSEKDRYSDEVEHQVTLNAFLMSKYEITNAQYAAFLNAKNIGSNGLYPEGRYPTKTLIFECSDTTNWGLNFRGDKWLPADGCENNPVINVTWFGADEFATFLGGSLPTESQWECACRASTSSPFSTGPCLTNMQANYWWAYQYNTCINSVEKSPRKPLPVGSYPPNPYGLCDMHGNVWEWCSDWYGPYPTTAQISPRGATTSSGRVYRGGSFSNYAHYCRSAVRFFYYPEYYSNNLGFRIVFEQ